MSRRIEVELTSARDDGSWTWRAAGARQPKGVVEAGLVPAGVKVGDVLRADADFDVDGVTLTALAPVAPKHRNEAERIEIIGSPRADEPLVTSTFVPKERGDRRDRGDRGERRDRGDRGDRGERRDRSGPRGERPDRPRREGPARTGPPDGGERRGPPADRERRDGRPAASADGGRDRRPPRPRPETPPKPKPKRLRARREHRAAVLAELPAEHRPIAEQVLQGDIPAVRQAIDKENEGRAAKGESPIDGTELIAIAERLRPRLRTAEWHDKAEAALADIDELDLRDLRSVVVAADAAARDEATRSLASQLREALTKRVEAEQAAWLSELTEALDEGRVVRALRLSSRPPKAGTLLRPELAAKMSEAASASLTELAASDRWAVLLDAVAHSPVRLTVKPQSVPKAPSDELLVTIKKLAPRIPEIAALFGIEATAPAPRREGRRPPKPPKPPVLGSGGGQPAAEQAAEPAAEQAAEPVAEQAAEPVADHAAEPVVEPSDTVASEPAEPSGAAVPEPDVTDAEASAPEVPEPQTAEGDAPG